VHGLAYRLLGNPSGAVLVAQEVYRRIHRTTSKMNPTLDPDFWVDSITYAVVDDLRRGLGSGLNPEEQFPEAGASGPGEGEGDRAGEDRRRRDRQVQEFLLELPAPARDLLVLSQYQGLPLSETAAILGRRESSLERELPRDLRGLGRRLREGEAGAPASTGELEEAGRAAVKGLSEVYPDPNVRDRIRRGFVLGGLVSNADFFAPPRPRWVTALRWSYLPVALLGFLVLGYFMNRGPEWMTIDAGNTGSVTVNGRLLSLSDPRARGSLGGGSRVELASNEPLLLLCPGRMALEVETGTRLRLPNPPGRWVGKRARGELTSGAVRIATGPEFRGATLELETPQGVVHVREGVGGIACGEDRTRVELLTGEGELGPDRRHLEPVRAGQGASLGETPGVSPPSSLGEGEANPLRRFRDRTRSLLEETTETADEGEGAE
jgi:DNA-directed RNA polymerase specialized sigma24 family protein